MTSLNRPGNQPGRSPRVPIGVTRAGGVTPMSCLPCEVGDHDECTESECDCAHVCACGQHPAACSCDALTYERWE